MKTVNSLSGGKTSSYIAKHYPADHNVFALVRTSDVKCKFPDEKIRKEVEDRIQAPFIGTLEMDTIVYTMLDLEQFIGKKIDWVTGKTFDEIILRNNGTKKYLPNVVARFCTSEMKIEPIKKWWLENIKEPVEMRIGYRANEQSRAKKMMGKCIDGFLEDKFIVGKHKNGNNKWQKFTYSKPKFPLIDDVVFKDQIEEYWKDKDVRFAYMNNCVGCFHRNPVLLNHMSHTQSNKFDWFVDQEGDSTFIKGMKYSKIKKMFKQVPMFDDEDFNECDSGYCGV